MYVMQKSKFKVQKSKRQIPAYRQAGKIQKNKKHDVIENFSINHWDMKNKNEPAIFENFKIRRHYNELKEIWYFSVVDIIQALLEQPDFQTARKYWNKLKERLKKEGSESVTKCHQLKMEAADGKFYLTDAANAEKQFSISNFVNNFQNKNF